MWYALDPDGDPFPTTDEAAAKFIGTKIAVDRVSGYLISTVFIALDHSLDGPVPMIYETMIFSKKDSELYDRYPNKIAALAGHDQAVLMMQDRILDGEGLNT